MLDIFQRLKIDRRWRRWLCGPPIQWQPSAGHGDVLYTASCSAPVGFEPSAGWAHDLTDTVTDKAGLRPQHRLRRDHVIRGTLPLWGAIAIVDDVWAIL